MNGKPVIVEMVGVAGVGKTTLEDALHQRNPRFGPVPPPPVTSYIPFLASSARFWLLTCAREYSRDGLPPSFRIRRLAYLEVWRTYVTRWALSGNRIAILNPGPVYWLCALQGCTPPPTTEGPTLQRAKRAFDRWSGQVRLLIWLDAADDVLLQRLYARDHWRTRQGQSPQEIVDHHADYRIRYAQRISAMRTAGGPQVLRFRTDRMRPEEIADRVLVELGLGLYPCG